MLDDTLLDAFLAFADDGLEIGPVSFAKLMRTAGFFSYFSLTAEDVGSAYAAHRTAGREKIGFVEFEACLEDIGTLAGLNTREVREWICEAAWTKAQTYQRCRSQPEGDDFTGLLLDRVDEAELPRLRKAFRAYSGDDSGMGGKAFIRCIRDSGICRDTHLKLTVAGQIFAANLPEGCHQIDLIEFAETIAQIAKQAGMPENETVRRINDSVDFSARRSRSPSPNKFRNTRRMLLGRGREGMWRSPHIETSERAEELAGALLVDRLDAMTKQNLKHVFFAYACGTPRMDGRMFVKCLRESGLLEETPLTVMEVDVIFVSYAPKGSRSIDFVEFCECLAAMTTNAGLLETQVVDRISATTGPHYRSNSPSTPPDYGPERFYYDTSSYTGTHRFGRQSTRADMATSPLKFRRGRRPRSLSSTPSPSRPTSPAGARKNGFPSPSNSQRGASRTSSPSRPTSPARKGGKVMSPVSARRGGFFIERHDSETLQTLKTIFSKFAGNSFEMDGRSFVKCLRDADVFRDTSFTVADADLLFACYKPPGCRHIDFSEFGECIGSASECAGLLESVVLGRIIDTGGPKYESIAGSSSSAYQEFGIGPERFYYDRTTYTGTHRHGGPQIRNPDALQSALRICSPARAGLRS